LVHIHNASEQPVQQTRFYAQVMADDPLAESGGSVDLTRWRLLNTNDRRLALREWLQQDYQYIPYQAQLDELIRAVINSRIDAQACYCFTHPLTQVKQQVRRFKQRLYVVSDQRPLLNEINWEVNTKNEALPSGFGGHWRYLSAEYGLKPGHYQIKRAMGYERFKPLNRPTKSLKKWWQEYGIPSWLRDQWPVIFSEDQVAALPGLAVGHVFSQSMQVQLHWWPYISVHPKIKNSNH
jgi:tRNA(Ile)-lysidine synthase